MSKKDIVELEMDEDGSYAPVKTKEKKDNKKAIQKSKAYGRDKYSPDSKPMIFKESHADDFLSGVDAGLDFIDKVMPRVERFLRLRG
jgi:hypothetical protein